MQRNYCASGQRRFAVIPPPLSESPVVTGKVRQGFLLMIQKKIEFPEKPQPEHIVLLVELIAAFQKIPQRYCLLCKAKTNLGIDGHKPDCPLRRAFNFVKTAKQE